MSLIETLRRDSCRSKSPLNNRLRSESGASVKEECMLDTSELPRRAVGANPVIEGKSCMWTLAVRR